MREVFFSSFLAGLLGNFLTYGWIGNFGSKVAGGDFIILMFLIPSLTAFFSIKVIVSEFISRWYPGLGFLIYPSVWIIVDFIQSIGFLAFPWPYIGYSQYSFTSFIQLSSYIGILGINFILVMFNITLSRVITECNFRQNIRRLSGDINFIKLIIQISFIIIITTAGYISIHKEKISARECDLKIAIIQTCISPWENWPLNKHKYLAELIRYSEQSMQSEPDFIIWSESATLETISFRAVTYQPDSFDRELYDFVKRTGKPLFTGEIGVTLKEEEGFYRVYPQNNAILIDGTGKFIKTYPKINLVPFGEWFPYGKIFPAVKQLAAALGGSDFLPGRDPDIFTLNNYKFAPLICYEGIFFRLCRKYRQMGADFLVNITNDGWTNKYSGHYQHFSASVFRAVENGIWVVRAGNTGVSALIDPLGRVRTTMPILHKGYISGCVDLSLNRVTFYQKHGDIILGVSLLFIVLLITGYFIRKYLIFKYKC